MNSFKLYFLIYFPKQSSILNFLAFHITALFFKMSFFKGSPLKTPVGHNSFSMFQILISLCGDQQASPTKGKIEIPSSRAKGCFQKAKLKRKECITCTNCLVRGFTVSHKGKKAVLPGISPLPVILDSSLWDTPRPLHRHVDNINNITISCKKTQMTSQPLPPPSLLCVNKSYPGCLSNV